LSTRKVSDPFAVNACPPIAVVRSVALAAQPVGFGKVDQIAIDEVEFVPVLCIVAAQAPRKNLRRMLELDLGVLGQFSLCGIYFHAPMAITARKNPWSKGWPLHRKFGGAFLRECQTGKTRTYR
jgi:hypothetical protein